MKCNTRFFTLFFILLLALSGCGRETQNSTAADTASISDQITADDPDHAIDPSTGVSDSVEFKDMIGRTLTLTPGTYQRVVCIGAGALRMYCYIGDVDLLCGVEDIDNLSLSERPAMFDGVARPYMLAYGEQFKSLLSCGVGGPNAQAAEAEKILSCDPDIVISEYEDVEKADALQMQLGVPVVTLRTGADGVFAEEFKGSLELLGQIFGKEARADELLDFVDSEVAAIREAAAQATADVTSDALPAAYICGLGNWGTTNHLMTARNFKPFEIAGIRNVIDSSGVNGVQAIEAETFVALGASMDVMLLDAAAVKNIKPLYREDSTMFDCCKAWTTGEVYLQMAYNVYYTNFEIALANTWFAAKSVYPEQFAEVDMTAKLNEITTAFLGQELADAIYTCPASFGGYQQIDTATFFG